MKYIEIHLVSTCTAGATNWRHHPIQTRKKDKTSQGWNTFSHYVFLQVLQVPESSRKAFEHRLFFSPSGVVRLGVGMWLRPGSDRRFLHSRPGNARLPRSWWLGSLQAKSSELPLIGYFTQPTKPKVTRLDGCELAIGSLKVLEIRTVKWVLES